jgi:hypothetical protein
METDERFEVAAAIIEPHFAAVRDVFCEYDGGRLARLRRTRLLVSDEIRNSKRHYAGCREDGLAVIVAPEAAELAVGSLVALLAHEFGHACDFCYPAMWVHLAVGKPAAWAGDAEPKRLRKLLALWNDRSSDQIEWAADSIVMAVTGKEVRYCGDCLVQCFAGGTTRPPGLR